MPLTVALAFSAPWFSVSCEPAAVGSYVSADRPVVASPSSTVSLVVILKPFSAPVAVERSDRRAPFASVMIEAVTPALAPLILSRMAASEVSPAPIVIETGPAPLLAAKAEGGVPDQVPS